MGSKRIFEKFNMNRLNVIKFNNRKSKGNKNMSKVIKSIMFSLSLVTLFMLSEISVNAKELEKSRTTFTEQESLVLQKIAIAEAGVEGIGGMAFVMQAVINRMESEEFPNTIYDVVSESGQFSSFSNGSYQKAQPTENSKKAFLLLNTLQNQGQLYFEITSENSWQSRNLCKVFTYSNHTFYK